MNFLEGLFDLGDRKRRKSGRLFQNGDHHDDDHDDEHDNHNHNHHQQQQYSANPNQIPIHSAAVLSGIVCHKCSTQTLQGAKFCHGCGTAIETISNCASCGSKLPANAPFCPQCGYRNG